VLFRIPSAVLAIDAAISSLDLGLGLGLDDAADLPLERHQRRQDRWIYRRTVRILVGKFCEITTAVQHPHPPRLSARKCPHLNHSAAHESDSVGCKHRNRRPDMTDFSKL